ncbi:MAG: type 4a pilus biogenesis protein PilO, partial [Actinomycetota bacterium]|nr:type 4a pilus biogenesis protein PilO [Actinomycetota bacterium]
MTKTRVWSAFAAVAMVAVLAAGWFLLVSPKRGEAAELREQTVTQGVANALLETKLKQLVEQHKQLPAKRAELADLAAQIPGEPGLPDLIRQLTADAKAAGVDLKSIAPGDPAPLSTATGTAAATGAPQILQVAVAVNVSGEFYEHERMLEKLESMRRLFQVTGFTVSPRQLEAGQRIPVIDMTINGRVFMLSSGPVLVAPATAAGGATPAATPTSSATPGAASEPAGAASTPGASP